MLGISSIIDWDVEAMADIEEVRTCKVGGINRTASVFWRLHEVEPNFLQSVSPKPVTKENSHVQDQNDQGRR